jgi:transposase
VCRRARGRAKHNAWRKYLATLRRQQVVDLLLRYGFKYGVGALIAAELRVHKSTVSRDIKALFPLMRTCPHGHQMMPHRWWADDPAEGP